MAAPTRQGAPHHLTQCYIKQPTAMQELLKEMERLAENGDWADLETALQRVQGAPNDAATNLRYAAIRAGPQDTCDIYTAPPAGASQALDLAESCAPGMPFLCSMCVWGAAMLVCKLK